MNWKQIIFDLRESGLTQVEIASRANVAQSAISELSSGKTTEPRFSTGQRLQKLHRSVMRRKVRSEPHPQQEASHG